MKNIRTSICTFIIFLVLILGISALNSKLYFNYIRSNDSKTQTWGNYTFEKTKKTIIEKNFDGNYLYPLVTIALDQDTFSIKLKGLDKDKNVYIINPDNGKKSKLKLDENNIFSINTSFEKDTNYGIIMDYKLIGSIRVVDDLNIKNENELYMDILTRLGCGL